MVQTALRYGLQKAAVGTLSGGDAGKNVGQHVEQLIQVTQDPQLSGQLHSALKDPQSVIEIRCGKQIGTVTPQMPLRELLSPEAGAIEITVSKPHAGG